MAYRWEHIDAVLAAQLELAGAGLPAVIEAGHTAVGYASPATGTDALPTMRTEFHPLRAGTTTRAARTSASSVWLVFAGTGTAVMNRTVARIEHGDVIAAPSWTSFALHAEDELDLFTFSHAVVFEKLNLLRTGDGA